MKKYIIIFLLTSSAMAGSFNTVKVLPFVENQVVPITASTFTVTEIQFGSNEKIQSIQNGDVAAWTVDVNKTFPNVLFLKPTMAGSNTNMTVITNQYTYYFRLKSVTAKNNALYALKFRYPKPSYQAINLNVSHLPSEYHWDYSFHGSKTIMPIHVFDDGRFTYFQLRHSQTMPAIFAVDNKKGRESVVNFRREGRYLVVHRLAPQFTLRSGKYQVASIFNNRLTRARQ